MVIFEHGVALSDFFFTMYNVALNHNAEYALLPTMVVLLNSCGPHDAQVDHFENSGPQFGVDKISFKSCGPLCNVLYIKMWPLAAQTENI